MLSFRGVSKKYQLDEKNTIMPVRDLSLDIMPEEFIVVMGRSGTGKTTLLNLAAGLVRPTQGNIIINGTDMSAMSDRQVSALRAREIGFIFQFPSLLPSLTVIENIRLPSIFTGLSKNNGDGDRASELLDMLGLSDKADVFPRQLSAGEQKRIVIARSLMNRPNLVLADEPTSDLDDRTEDEVMAILRDINKSGVTFLIVTHNRELADFSSRAFEMGNGTLRQLK